MLYSSNTCAVNEEAVKRVEHAEMRRVRWTCNGGLRGGAGRVEARRLGCECISEMMMTGRLCWLSHVERKDAVLVWPFGEQG